jgi:hypothetical protein
MTMEVDCDTFQDGDQQIYQGFNSFRYVDNVSRFDRRLFPYSYFSEVLQVPEICLGRQGIRFQDDAFWPIYSRSSIYQNSQLVLTISENICLPEIVELQFFPLRGKLVPGLSDNVPLEK